MINIGKLTRPPRLAEFLDMRAPEELAGQMTRVDEFVQEQPVHGAPVSQRTEAYLGYDEQHLYVIFCAFDTDRERIRAHVAKRETLTGDDLVQIRIDTFNDEQRAYSFQVNPFGVQSDAIYSEGGQQHDNETGLTDKTWDTVWHSHGEITDAGYVVLVTIPFRNMRFDPTNDQTWGVILTREIKRLNEIASWPAIDKNKQGRLNQAAKMQGLHDISRGRNLQLISSVTARRFKVLDEGTAAFARESLDPEAGVDAKWVFQDRLTLDLTANPEFSQVESDLPQLTANERFELFYPEKRPFFLENAAFFTTPLDQNTSNKLLFTRRIAQPRAGARLTGKLGKFSLGSLLIDDEAPGLRLNPDDPDYGERANLGVLRVSRDFGDQSTIGLLYTDYSFADSVNRVGGLDGRYKLGDHWNALFQMNWSQTHTRSGERLSDTLSNVEVNRNSRNYSAHYHYTSIGSDFISEAGFMPRPNQVDYHMDHRYTFWPEGKWLISWGPMLSVLYLNDQDGHPLDRRYLYWVDWNFRGPTKLTVIYTDASNRLYPEEFPFLSAVKRFDRDTITIFPSAQILDSLELNGSLTVGDGINFFPAVGEPLSGKETMMSLGFTWRPTSRLRIGATASNRDLVDRISDDRIVRNRIAQLRFDYQFTPRASLRSIVQQDWIDARADLTSVESDQRYNGDMLFTYQVNLWTALYVGYNTSFRNFELVPGLPDNTLRRTDERYMNDAHQWFIKFSHLFQP